MDVNIKINNDLENLEIESVKFQKMAFLFNALDKGWCVKKKKDTYVFVKKHKNKKEILDDKYLTTFMIENINITNLM